MGIKSQGKTDKTKRPVRLLVAFGTRPEVLKLYPVIQQLRKFRGEFEVVVLATAQHRGLLDQTLHRLAMPVDHDLNIMTSNQSLSQITIRVLKRIDAVLRDENPDMILVQGDTTTTFSVALAAFYRGIPVGHVEAGLRTRDRFDPFPEEVNRQLTSVLAALHFAPTREARLNLLAEKVQPDRIYVTGNTIIDALHEITAKLGPAVSKSRTDHANQKPLILVTAHRRESLGEPMRRICQAVARLAAEGKYRIVFPVHPNPRVRNTVNTVLEESADLVICPPMEYDAFLRTLLQSSLVITDSGGVQEEAAALGVPTLVTRAKTERPEGIKAGIATLVGSDTDRIVAAARRVLSRRSTASGRRIGTRAYGDGRAAQRVVQTLRYLWGFRTTRPPDFSP